MKKIAGYLSILGALASLSPAVSLAQVAGDLSVASFEEVLLQPVATSGKKLAYGPLPQQFGDLRIPASAGKHPIVMLIHGGCWLADYDLSYMEALSDALTAQGYATWNIEFRRIGEAGGGWPGTFDDVREALGFLIGVAPEYSLDLSKIVVLGHSSGGQLALWLAADNAHHSAMTQADNNLARIHTAVSLAGITDLRSYRKGPPGSCHSAVDDLLDGDPDRRATRYANASPLERLPIGTRQILLQGTKDPVVTMESAVQYSNAARKAGDDVKLIKLNGGHFDVVMARGPAFRALTKAIQESLASHSHINTR